MLATLVTREFLANPATASPSTLRDRLAVRLLDVAGDVVVWMEPEPHAEEILDRGQVFQQPVRQRRGQRNRCHENSARLWGMNSKKCQLVTGYALSNDRKWRQHTWVVSKNLLHETTEPRTRYYGVALNELESLRFWLGNFVQPWQIDLVTGPPEFKARYAGPLALMEKLGWVLEQGQ